jgi:MinD-like ATPase involved in chromosome partitioning or flagellar assembly
VNKGARRARIITFYSYKGGTGRSMALANAAWILASNGMRVLAIDWDLEAPGLHRYFQPFIDDKELTYSEGVIDFVMRYARDAVKPPTGDNDWYIPLANLRRYACSLHYPFPKSGTVDLVPAGRQGPDYATRVNSFNWQNFYERLDGGAFLEAAKRSVSEYDFVLVDSRTGVSDTSGICTVQIPDTLMVCFTPNNQSIEGAAAVAESAMSQRLRTDQKPGLMIYPVMTRVTQGETERVQLARQAARKRFDPLIWQIPEAQRELYWAQMSVAHQDFYGFEEVLAVFADEPNNANTMLASMELITGCLLRTREEWEGQGAKAVLPTPLRFPSIENGERKRLLSLLVRQPDLQQAAREPATRSPIPPSPPPPSKLSEIPKMALGRSEPYWFYLSYARGDDEALVRRLFAQLENEIRLLTDADGAGFMNQMSLDKGESWAEPISQALASARTFIALLSPAYVQSAYCGREFEVFRLRSAGAASNHIGVLPLVWIPMRSERVPQVLASIQLYSTQNYGELKGVRQLFNLSKNRDAAKSFVSNFCRELIGVAKAANVPPLLSIPSPESIRNAFADAIPEVVNFVFLAPTKSEAVEMGLDGSYGEDGGAWQPFGGAGPHASEFAYEAAVSRKLNYKKIPADDDLPKCIWDADRNQQMIINLIDERGLRLGRLRDLVQRVTEIDSKYCWFLLIENQGPKVPTPTYMWFKDPKSFERAAYATSERELTDQLQRMLDQARLRVNSEFPEPAPIG